MKKFVLSIVVGGLLVGLSLIGTPAQARPNYHKAFIAKYPALADAAKTEKCNVCHFGEEKKNRNDYGAAMGKHLPGKNCKDDAAINESLAKAESDKNSDGKTFGELIKSGKLPGKAP